MLAHVRVALIAVMLFGSVLITSGRIREGNGLGYDGVVYGQMVTDGLEAGFPNARLRPLILLVNRAIHRTFGTDVVTTFIWTNVLFMFLLAFSLALLLERYGAPEYVRAAFVANVALSIATAQVFAYYPVLVDLGALAVIVLAAYCAVAAPAWAAAAASVAAVASREFGMAVVLFGIHRELRLRRPVRAVATYLPAVLAFVAIRWYVRTSPSADSSPEGNVLTAAELLGNAAYWLSPWFVFFFAYFLVTVFGGLSAFLIVHLRRAAQFVRHEHELLSLLVPVLALAALGSADIWRYLVYLLPAAAILFAAITRQARRLGATLAVITLFTVVTQRPWREMTEDLYFSHWFPYYAWLANEPLPVGMVGEWARRAALAAAGLLLVSVAMGAPRPAADPAHGYHVRR